MLNAICLVSMRHHPKTFIASLLASVLLYYGAAWALLRCCHHDSHASVHESLSDSDVHQRQAYSFSPNHASTYIDCIEDLAIHTEILASSTAPSPLQRVASFTKQSSHPITCAVLTHGSNAYLTGTGQVSARGSPHPLYANTSIYLSLSILRI